MPALAQVLFELVEWIDAQLPLDLRHLLLLGRQHLSESLDLIFNLQPKSIQNSVDVDIKI